MSQTKMKNDKQKMKNTTGGYNVAWLILVQAAVWNVLLPLYLINTGLFAFALGAYFAALIAVASKETAPDYKAMNTEELIQHIEEQRIKDEEYKLIPSRIKTKLRKTRTKKSRVQPLLHNTLAQ